MEIDYTPEGNDRYNTLTQGIFIYRELWEAIRVGKWRIVGAVILGLLGSGVYCALAGPWYEANAQLLVLKKRLETAPISGPDPGHGQEDYLATHMHVLTSRRVILQAINEARLQDLDQFQEQDSFRKTFTSWVAETVVGTGPDLPREEKIATKLINLLVVSRDPPKPGMTASGEILNLSIKGKVPGDCPIILNAVIASYEAFLRETYRNTNAETLVLIGQARGMVQRDLEAKEADYQRFLAETPPICRGQDRHTLQQDQLFRIGAQLAAVRLRQAELEACIRMIESALKKGRNVTAVVERVSGVVTNREPGGRNSAGTQEAGVLGRGPRGSLDEELLGLRLQEAKLLAIRPANHPEVMLTRAQIDAVRAMLVPAPDGDGAGMERRVQDQELGMLKTELLKQELDDLKLIEQSLTKLFESEQQGVSASIIHEVQDEAHRKGIERSRLLYEGILRRLEETSSVKDFGGYNAQVIGPPLRGELAMKRYLFILGVGLFSGTMIGMAGAYLAQYSMKTRHVTNHPHQPAANNARKALPEGLRDTSEPVAGINGSSEKKCEF